MTNRDTYRDLTWLPEPPDDFSDRCRNALDSDCQLGLTLQALAQHALDENQLNRLARVVEKTEQAKRSLDPLIPFRLAIVSNATSHFITPALIATALRHGLALECIETDFGQIVQEVLEPDSRVHRSRPDAILLAIDHRGLPLKAEPGAKEAAATALEACLNYLEMIRSGIHRNGNAVCILQTIPRPAEADFGSFDFILPGTMRSVIDAVNRGIAAGISGTTDLLFDVAAVAETVGLANWHDPMLWNMAKLPFSNQFLPLYAEHLCRIIAAVRGRSRRCLILDLDNTVWGGVIGEDGLEGIVIGQGDPTGEAHLAVQRTALELRNRGVVLAVSSKNDDATARLPFRKHPEMLLKEHHIAVFQANWQDKASNIKAIATELSLGIDSMVFLDDNPIERNLVRQLLPQVAVPELPDDPALYARTLSAAGYFEVVTFSVEDQQRADFYQGNARRASLEKIAGGIDAYLASLGMVITFQPFDETGRARITQLINKSNQFNLTTKRYTEADIRDFEKDQNVFTLQVRLADMFGDNGMISVIICRRIAREWHIDTWLMSCRVLGRKVETMVLQEMVRNARSTGIERLIGTYRPTERNKLVEDHYVKLGFTHKITNHDGSSVWELIVSEVLNETVPMEVRRLGLDFCSA